MSYQNASMTIEPDTSLDLFDIDENDFEYEHDYQEQEIDNSFSRDLQTLHSNAYSYPTFSAPHLQAQPQPFIQQPTFADPFHHAGTHNGLHNQHMLNNIAESVEHHFHAGRQQPPQKPYFDDMLQSGQPFYNPVVTRLPPQFNQGMPQSYHTPSFVHIPHIPHLPMPANPTSVRPMQERSFSTSISKPSAPPLASIPENPPTDCSVCLVSYPSTLAVLQPCRHPLCRSCLTSALNIVGEKDMECAVCKQSVADFNLINVASKTSAELKTKSNGMRNILYGRLLPMLKHCL